MRTFMDKDFLLSTETSRKLFHEYAENMPIIDYHCHIDPREIAEVLAERTNSQVVQVIGKKIVLYKEGKKEKKKIQLPK